MSEGLFTRARDVFLGAWELSGEERQLYLDHACGDDEALRREVESLLTHHPTAGLEEISPKERPEPEGTHRFRVGELFAERYRIVSLLGRGGMGEVYRAEDETLGVSVAIKVFSEAREDRDHLLSEVRLAREITHPAICRVHDLGEWQGETFLTMEYVAGEDLASLLRRIGRLPPDKLLDIARQLCAGLAAAHAQGVLHRDLKPGNVLIDPEGRVRIADFGIAVARDRTRRGDTMAAGTPAYMAPELLLPGRSASESSDLYALGVMLYELATGQLPVAAKRGRLAPPSSFVSGLDPALERAILRCLEPDPEARPASVLGLAASLPGSDPLSLAAEVEVTPSPEVVAAAGSSETVWSPGRLWGVFAGLFVFLLAALALGEASVSLPVAGVVKAPEALADRAREIASSLGYHAEPEDPRYGYLDDPSPPEIGRAVLFWYRHSLVRALPEGARRYLHARPFDPDPRVEGKLVLILDQSGRLVFLQADPVLEDGAKEARSSPLEGSEILGLAGLDPASLRPVASEGELTDRFRWQGLDAEGRDVEVEAAVAGGRWVYFSRVSPQDEGSELAEERSSLGGLVRIARFLILGITVLAVPLAFFNLRAGHGDRRGAARLVTVVLVALGSSWLLRIGWMSHPLQTHGELVVDRLVLLLSRGVWIWVGYLAVEPFVRRIWPRTLVAWSRALEGRSRDPLVGQSLLVGLSAGAFLGALGYADVVVPRWLGLGEPAWPLAARLLENALSTPLILSAASLVVVTAVYDGLFSLVILVVARRLLKRRGPAALAFGVVYFVLIVLTGGGYLPISWLLHGIPGAAVGAYLMVRFGLLAYVASRYVFYLLDVYPLTLDSGLWYSGSSFFAAGLVLAIGAWGLRLALGGSSFSRAVASDR